MELEDAYTSICCTYLKKNKMATIEDAEKVLFLMQYDRFKKEKRLVYEGMTYISEKGIRITYISDLLRVMPPTELGFYPSRPTVLLRRPSFHTILRNEKEAKEYAKLSFEEINEKVNAIIENEKLSRWDFTFKKYKNKKRRIQARYKARVSSKKSSKDMLELFGFFFLGIFVMMMIMFNIALLIKIVIGTVEKGEILMCIVLLLLVLIPWLIEFYRWTRPTDFEIENDYLI